MEAARAHWSFIVETAAGFLQQCRHRYMRRPRKKGQSPSYFGLQSHFCQPDLWSPPTKRRKKRGEKESRFNAPSVLFHEHSASARQGESRQKERGIKDTSLILCHRNIKACFLPPNKRHTHSHSSSVLSSKRLLQEHHCYNCTLWSVLLDPPLLLFLLSLTRSLSLSLTSV
jgi:hypothetical protein